MEAMLAEFRASLPEILEGRDPILFLPINDIRGRMERFADTTRDNRTVHISEPVRRVVQAVEQRLAPNDAMHWCPVCGAPKPCSVHLAVDRGGVHDPNDCTVRGAKQ